MAVEQTSQYYNYQNINNDTVRMINNLIGYNPNERTPSRILITRPISINDKMPQFNAPAIVNNKPETFRSQSVTSENIALYFYPGNFCNVTRTELKTLSEKVQQLQQLN